MGRILGRNNSILIKNGIDTAVRPAGFLGIFGQGLWRVITKTQDFVVPENVYSLRVRVIGNGGNGGLFAGGGGGGYVHGVIDVNPGQVFSLTIPEIPEINSLASMSGTISFDSLMSATGGYSGANDIPEAGRGGQGFGGDFRAKGGDGGKGRGAGGGGSGSQMGNGGNGAPAQLVEAPTYERVERGGGGGGINGDAYLLYGGSPFGIPLAGLGTGPRPNILGANNSYIINGTTSGFTMDWYERTNPIRAIIRFPFDGFVGGASGSTSTSDGAGIGGGGSGGGDLITGSALNGRSGNSGGGGGGGGVTESKDETPIISSSTGGNGALGGGGGSFHPGGVTAAPGRGGQGFIVVEW